MGGIDTMGHRFSGAEGAWLGRKAQWAAFLGYEGAWFGPWDSRGGISFELVSYWSGFTVVLQI